jgi:hypothetical protein
MAARLWMVLVMGASIREIAHYTYGVVRPTAVMGVTELRFFRHQNSKRGCARAPNPGVRLGSLADIPASPADDRCTRES